MPQIVEEHGQAERGAQSIPLGLGQRGEVLAKRVEDPPGNVAGAEGMHVAGVGGTGEGGVGESHLAHPAEPLEKRRIDHLSLAVVEEDGAVDGVADAGRGSVFHAVSLARLAASFKANQSIRFRLGSAA